MKIAIVHDVFIEQGGAERVLQKLIDMYPAADIFIPLITHQKTLQLQKVSHGRIITSALNHIPFVHSASVLLKPLLYWYWETLDLTSYELVISSSHSFSAKSVLTGPNTLHIAYIHTPPRYLYTEFNETRIIKQPLFKLLLTPLLTWLRQLDFIGSQRPDIMCANSQTVARRIAKYYRRESHIIYPPVQIPTRVKKKKGEYFVCFSRLAKQKGIDLAIQACNQLQLPLVVIGEGSEETYLKSIAGPTIKFVGFVSDQEVATILAKAKALIYCSREEDFGLVPVEVQAHGVPVIAFKSGGAQETVVPAKTGLFFEEYSVASLITALQSFRASSLSALACRKHAQKYSDKVFERQIRALINTSLATSKRT